MWLYVELQWWLLTFYEHHYSTIAEQNMLYDMKQCFYAVIAL